MALVLCVMLSSMSIWLSSGTLSPYALTSETPSQTEKCGYLHVADYLTHYGANALIDGQPREVWENSQVLRRILHPLLSYPFMKLFGYEEGGLLANLIFNALAIVIFAYFLKRTVGLEASLLGMGILATYPGITYWGGLPYSYALVIPVTLILAVILEKFQSEERLQPLALWSLIMGILFLGYDLFPFFGLATLFIFAARKKYRFIPIFLILSLLPAIMWQLIQQYFFDMPFASEKMASDQSMIYINILKAYLGIDSQHLVNLMTGAPYIFENGKRIFLYSTFYYLPIFFLILLFSNFIKPLRLAMTEQMLILSFVIIFVFIQAAPHYSGWELSTPLFDRIYQSLFVVYLLFAVKRYQQLKDLRHPLRHLVLTSVLAVILLNFPVSLGSVLKSKTAAVLYSRFYPHSEPRTFFENLEKYGQRPIGFCKKN